MKKLNRQIWLLAGASTLAFACTANAQTVAGESELEEIVVTGSRVITNGNDSPTPVTVVTTEELTAVRPGNLAESLNDMPVFGGSRSQNSNTGTSGAAGSPATSNNAGNVVNLRSLGLLRTLVLFDGHRAPPSTPDGFVDVDTIPQMLIQRVDVVTGGVSAVYGSDAISGVVNFVTDTKFDGIKGNLQAGRSTYSDADSVEGGIAFGTNLFDGRGHVMGSFSTRHNAGIDSKQARPWGKDLRTLQGNGTANVPYYQVNGVRVNNATFGGKINSGVLNDKQFTSGGFLTSFAHGIQTGTTGGQYEIGGDGGYFNQQLRASLEMNQGYGRFDFDFTDDLHGYVSVSDTLSHSVGTADYYSNTAITISRDNAYLQPQYVAQLTTAGQTTFTFGKIFTSIPRSEIEGYNKQLLINAGLQGGFGDGYKWEVSYTNSNGEFDVRQNAAINQGRLFAALDSVVSNGQAVCRASLTNAAYAGCVPLNPFGVNSESQASLNYIMGRGRWVTDLGMDDVSASITGAPFSTWAGPINSALSAEWRKLSYQIDSDSPSTARADCAVPGGTLAGVAATSILNCNANTVYWNRAAVNSVPQVSTTVSEAALEFNVPLLKDVTAAKSLDLNTAYRFAHYDRSGNANTWKVGVTWDPLDMLTVRATRSRDFRAPSLDEMFRPLSVSFTNFPDTLAGSAVPSPTNVRTENGGNPDLKPEIGDTLTYGVVVRPTDNFDIAVDAFDIKLNDAIFLIQGNTPVYQNVCYASGGSSPYCQLIGRGLGSYSDPSAANAVNLWRQTFINLAQQHTWGADIEANFRTEIASRPLSLRVLTTYQPHIVYKQAGVQDFDYAGVSFGTNGIQASPVWRVTGFVNFKPVDSITVSVQERWRSSLKHSADPLVYVASPNVKSVAYTNLNVSYSPKIDAGKIEFFANVQNLFNTDPPKAGFWGNPNPGNFGEFAFGDDVIGRYYTAGVRVRM